MPNLEPTKCPQPLYVFVNQANPVTWNNFNLTGRFCSAAIASLADPAKLADYHAGTLDFLPFEPKTGFSGFMSPFLNNVITDYRVEWDAEQARRRHAPDAPARLSAVFAFGSYADCQAVSQKYPSAWPLAEVHEFKLVSHPLTRIRRVNMEIVSLARGVYPRAMWSPQDIDAIWSSYWSGSGDLAVEIPAPPPVLKQTVSSGCIWEYLIDGCLDRVH